MSRMTQEIARSVAKRMTDKKTVELKKSQKQLSSLAFEIANSMIPQEVLICFKKHCCYFETTNALAVNGKGLNFERIEFTPNLPSPNGNTFSKTLEGDQAIQVESLLSNISRLKKEIDKLETDVEKALLSLKTYNRVKLEFPEAYPYLPVRITQELTVNINKIREQISNL